MIEKHKGTQNIMSYKNIKFRGGGGGGGILETFSGGAHLKIPLCIIDDN